MFPLRTALVVLVILAVLVPTGHFNAAITVSISATFMGMIDAQDSLAVRLTVFWRAGALMTAGTLLGLLVSGNPLAHVVAAGVAALVCGYAGIIGPRAAMAGVLSLVLYAVYSGSPERGWDIWQTLIELVIGMLAYAVVAAATTPLFRSFVTARSVYPPYHPVPLGDVLRIRLDFSNLYLRHAVRLSLAIMIATVLEEVLNYPHAYWIPMTVAWIAKPDLSGTVSKTLYRVIGTACGVLICVIALATHPPVLAITVLVACLGAWIVTSFLWANYSIAVAGITIEVLSLFYLDHQDLRETAPSRILSTILAGIIVVLASYAWRSKEADPL